ncbi:uncharacterized protein LOC111637400 isoform X2 [Centruroides sculpturatus]|nr:uncharacterized protein LOC111637400 isoform X2 [Centruroides sculpturatus]XP_023238648.1 uncharacterized protein LOC111637400 isoform X2 [Centruroides sculpturatus]
MTRKIRDYLRLQPILPKPQNVALLTKNDCLPVYLVNLFCSQNRVDAEEFLMNQPDGHEWVGRLLKRRRILSNSKNVECKRLCISNKLHTSPNFENNSNNLVCLKEQVNPEESDIYNCNYGENVKSEDSSCEIGKSNTNIDVVHSVITKNVNNLSFQKTHNLAKCSNTSDNGQSSLLSSFRREEVENSINDKSNPLLSAMDCKVSKYEKTLKTFVKISPCLPETVNKSRDFFTIKKSGKKKFVLCKKTVKKLLQFVPPNYCNNDRCCPNLKDVILTGKGNNILKLENMNFNTSLVQNVPKEKVAIDLNNNAKQFVKCDDDNINHTTDNISENNKSIWTNVVPENQSNLRLDTNNLVDPGLKKGKIVSNADNLNSESIQNTKYICKEIITTGTEEPECGRKLSPSGNLHPKTLAVLRKYRKIAPRTKQVDEFKHRQTGVQSLNCVSSSKAKRLSCNKVHLQVEERAKSNKTNLAFTDFKNFESCCEQKCREKTSDNNRPYKIYSTFDGRNCKKAIYSVDNSSKIALTDILDMKDQKNLQSLTFSELVKLSEKYGEKVFHSLSLDEITKKATTEIFEHNNVSNDKLFNNYSKTDESHKKTNITTKNTSFHGNESYKTTGLNNFSCDIRGKSISETTCTSRPISGMGNMVNVCTLSFLQENNFDSTDTKSSLDYNKLITEDKCKFLKLFDLCHVEDKMAKIISVRPPHNEEILNVKNPLIPLHHLFKLAKIFRCKHKPVLYPKNEERLSSFGLTMGIASDDSKFRSISAGGNMVIAKNGHGRDEAWLLIPVWTTPRSSNPQERRGPAEHTPAITLPDAAVGGNSLAPFCGTQARGVISHCCTVSHHSKVSCSPSSTYHKLS